MDDFDGDGYPELLEFAFGLEPRVSDVGGYPPVLTQGGFLTVTLAKRSGVTHEVQSAGTLVDGLPDSFGSASTTVLVDDATTLKVRDNFSMSGTAARFVRVEVSAVLP